jgi:pimeloyl-ACP methyl ester carboxylesterase
VADLVLVHGTTQGPRGWDRLAAALEARGHRSVAVDLIEDPEQGVEHYVAAAVRQVPPDVDAPVVVAHSGAGTLLPGIARALGARRQVWLAAYIPDGGRSMLDEVRTAPTEVFNPEWPGRDPTADPVLATYFLFHDCDLSTLRWALTTVRRFSPPRLTQEVVPLVTAIPSTYVVAARDRALRPEWCRTQARARLGAEVVEIDAGHCPHVSRPDELAAILDRLAAQ